MAQKPTIADYVRERVTVRQAVMTTVLAIVGLVMLFVGASLEHNSLISTVLLHAGAVLFVTVVLWGTWEFVGKRAFLDEILEKAHIASELDRAGFISAASSFQDNISWPALIDASSTLHIFVVYAHTWRNSNRTFLRKWLLAGDASLTVSLPDPDNILLCQSLAARFKKPQEDIVRWIREATEDFRSLARDIPSTSSVTVYYVGRSPNFSFYCFRNVAVAALYCHRDDKSPVPTFVVRRGGWFYQFIDAERKCLIPPDGQCRPAPTPPAT